MQINKNIFRLYDIRGIAGVKFEPRIVEEYEKWYGKFPGITINLETTKAIGRAYGTFTKRAGGKRVIVGYEVRPYADELKRAFIDGILDTGIDVIDADKTTTGMIYFLTSYENYDGGVNITGSHNVYFYNGFKIMKKGTAPLYGEELQQLREMVEKEDFDIADQKGTHSNHPNPYEVYKKYILSHIKLHKKLNIVIDCGNGITGLFAKDLFESLGCNIVSELYFEPNAYFPNHVPDPEAPQNMKDLIDEVKKTGADLGIGFDADGDRVGFVNEKGELVGPDELLLLLAKDILSRNKGKKVLYDVKCTHLMEELIPEYGGIPLMHMTGHAPIKDTLRKDTDIIFGGETSGHFYFVEDYFRIDDAFWAAASLLQLITKNETAFSTMFAGIPLRVRTPEFKLPCEDSIKFTVVEEVRKKFSGKYKTIEIDGVRIEFDEKSWGLVRASNTSPYLTCRVEAETAEKVLEIKNTLADVLDTFDEIKDKLDRKNVSSFTGKLGFL